MIIYVLNERRRLTGTARTAWVINKAAIAEPIDGSGDTAFIRQAVDGMRAWLQGDHATAIHLMDEGIRPYRNELKQMPWLGLLGLLRVVGGVHPEKAFGAVDLTGHHVNWAGRALGTAIWQLRS